MANTISVTQSGTTKEITITWTANTNTYASIEIRQGSNLFGTYVGGFSYNGGSTGTTETYTFSSYGTYTVGLYTTVDGTGAFRAQQTITLNTPQLYTCYLFYDSIKATYLASGTLEDLDSGDTFRVDITSSSKSKSPSQKASSTRKVSPESRSSRVPLAK